MSQMIEGPRKTFLAAETGGAYIRWYVSDASTSPPTVSICGAANPSVGTTEAAVLATGPVTLLLANAQGTRKMLCAGVITGGNKVYAAADGEIASSGTLLEGLAFESSGADQDIIEVMGAFGEDVDEDWADGELMQFGTGNDAALLWSTGDASNHAMVVAIGDTSQQIHITDLAARATDWNRSAGTHPELAIHSNTTPATDYISIGNHDGTTATIDVVGGTTFNLDIAGTTEFTVTAAATTLPGMVSAVESVANTAGVGITGAAAHFKTSVEKIGTIIKTTILIDLTDLNGGGTADDIIGANGAGAAHLGQITAAVNGTNIGGKMTCLEAPAGSNIDVDLWHADEDSGVEDSAISALTGEIKVINAGNWSVGTFKATEVVIPANKYLYLTSGAATDAAFTAGIFLIELYGTA